MKFLIILNLLASTILATPQPHSKAITLLKWFSSQPKDQNRIISGALAVAGQFPWQVAMHVQTSSGAFFCGGSLISEHWVLTAAHCAKGATSFILRFGAITLDKNETSLVKVLTTSFIIHSKYNDMLNNDIALVKMEKPITYTDNIQPVKLPKRGSHVGVGEKLTVSGWGKISDSTTGVTHNLNFVELTTISNYNCSDVYGTSVVMSSTVCCKGNPEQSTCNGDSGGPLVTYMSGDTIHVGIVSFVHSRGCASGNPSGYIRTESFLSWINEHTGIAIE